MILEAMLISSGKAWKKITEGKAASKLTPGEEKKKREREVRARHFQEMQFYHGCGKGTFLFFLWSHSRKEGLKSHSCQIGSFLPLLVSEVAVLP